MKKSPIDNKTKSAKSISVTFACNAHPGGKKAFLAGDFNGWNPHSHSMVKRNGQFSKSIRLAPGKYQYKFIVDGEWQADPSAPTIVNELGVTNNVICV